LHRFASSAQRIQPHRGAIRPRPSGGPAASWNGIISAHYLRFSRGVVAGGEVVTFAAGVAAWPKDRDRLAEGKGQGVRLKQAKTKRKQK
jgi:hypothetical protein